MCHSDLHTVNGEWGVNKYPIAVGHEIGGIVTSAGANAAKKFKVGQKVAVGCMVRVYVIRVVYVVIKRVF